MQPFCRWLQLNLGDAGWCTNFTAVREPETCTSARVEATSPIRPARSLYISQRGGPWGARALKRRNCEASKSAAATASGRPRPTRCPFGKEAATYVAETAHASVAVTVLTMTNFGESQRPVGGIEWCKPRLQPLGLLGDSEGGDYPNVTEFGVVTQAFTTFCGDQYDPGNGSPFQGAPFSV